MRIRRRVLLQLTPLLDLMMTILFVQYVLLQDVSSDAVAARRDAVDARIKAEVILDDSRVIRERLANQNEGLAKERDDYRSKFEEAQKRLEEMQLSQQRAEKQAQEATKQLQRVGELAGKLFDVSPETLQALTGGMDAAQAGRISQELERIKKDASGLEELMKLDELRKRCDFWKVHVTYDGFVLFRANAGEVGRFPVGDSPEAVIEALVQIVSRMEEPKSIVLAILTHGNAREREVNLVMSALRKFLREQSDKPRSRSRFELSEWGFVPDEKQPSDGG